MIREIGLAGLIAATTWASTMQSFDPVWTFSNYSPYSGWIWVLLAAMVLVGLLRQRLPAVAFVGAAALFGVWPAAGSVLALTAFHAAGRLPRGRRLWTVLALVALVDCGAALLSSGYGWTITLAGHLVALLLCVGLPVGVHVLLGKADRLVTALRERTYYLEDNYRLAHSAARLQERSRIAEEMHDQLGHRLSLISLYAGELELSTAAGAPRAAGDARLIRGTVQTAMQELRTTLGVLRPAGLEEARLQPVEETGSRTDLARLVAESRSAGVPVELTWRGDDLVGVALPVRRAAHRLVREGLTNIHRHALGAEAVVAVECGAGRVRIDVSNGRPPDPLSDPASSGTGLGLVGVQERVQVLGGDFVAGTTPGGGFLVRAELPLTDRAQVPPGHRLGPSSLPRMPAWPPRGALRRRLSDGRGIAAVLSVGLAAIPALVAVLFNATSLVVPGDNPYKQQTQAAEIGMTQDQVVAFFGEDDVLARIAARTLETPPPAGATCLYIQKWDETVQPSIVRYCFHAGRLTVVDSFPIPDGD